MKKNDLLAVFLFGILLVAPIQALAEPPVSEDSPLTWETVSALAKDHSPALQSAELNVQLQIEAVGQAGASLSPQLTAKISGSTGRASDGSLSGVGGFNLNNSSSGADASLSLSQKLWDGGRIGTGVSVAKAQLAAEKSAAALAVSGVFNSVQKQFYQLWYAQELNKLSKSIVTRRSDQSELLKYRYASGLENRGSLLTAQANLADSQLTVAQSARDIALARLNLAQTISGDISSFGDALLVTASIPTQVSSENIYSLVNAHLSVQKAAAELESSRFDLESANTLGFPDISASLGASKALSFSNGTTHQDRISGQIGVSYSIWDGGSNGYGQRQAQLRVRLAELALQNTRTSILLALQTARNTWQMAVENLTLQNQFFQANLERANIAELQYKSGRLSFNEWILIENNLIQSQKAVLRAQLNVWQAESDWKNAKGDSFENN